VLRELRCLAAVRVGHESALLRAQIRVGIHQHSQHQ